MVKIIIIKIKSAGNRLGTFSISDDRGNILSNNVSKQDLIDGKTFSVNDEVKVIVINYEGNNCCNKSINIPISTLTREQNAAIEFEVKNTSSLWSHLTNPTLFNNFYGCIHPYIIEYPFTYPYRDEIVQSISDYTKAFTYLPSLNHIFDDNNKIQTNDRYFNKVVIYNDQQSSGLLELDPKPLNDMKAYLGYPKFNSNSKTILYTKSDNFYQFNTFWNVVKDKSAPIWKSSCESMSLDKVINEENMQYTTRSFRKEPIRAKDIKCRLILDNRSDTHLVSQFFTQDSQISYK